MVSAVVEVVSAFAEVVSAVAEMVSAVVEVVSAVAEMVSAVAEMVSAVAETTLAIAEMISAATVKRIALANLLRLWHNICRFALSLTPMPYLLYPGGSLDKSRAKRRKINGRCSK